MRFPTTNAQILVGDQQLLPSLDAPRRLQRAMSTLWPRPIRNISRALDCGVGTPPRPKAIRTCRPDRVKKNRKVSCFFHGCAVWTRSGGDRRRQVGRPRFREYGGFSRIDRGFRTDEAILSWPRVCCRLPLSLTLFR